MESYSTVITYDPDRSHGSPVLCAHLNIPPVLVRCGCIIGLQVVLQQEACALPHLHRNNKSAAEVWVALEVSAAVCSLRRSEVALHQYQPMPLLQQGYGTETAITADGTLAFKVNAAYLHRQAVALRDDECQVVVEVRELFALLQLAENLHMPCKPSSSGLATGAHQHSYHFRIQRRSRQPKTPHQAHCYQAAVQQRLLPQNLFLCSSQATSSCAYQPQAAATRHGARHNSGRA